MQFQVADLPPGRDPADVGRDDPEALAAAVDARHAVPRVPHRPAARGVDMSSLEGRAHAAERAAVLVAEHPNDLVRDQYVMKLAGELDIDPDRLRETVSRARRASARRVDARGGVTRAGRGTERRSSRARRVALGGARAGADERTARCRAVRRSGRAQRVRRVDVAGRGTNVWSRRRRRRASCCSGSRSRIRAMSRPRPTP